MPKILNVNLGDTINIFQYLDYRLFLKDWFDLIKKKRPHFSYRSFSRLAGFRSPGMLQRVIDGERNLADESVTKCIGALKLNFQEADYFKNLVNYSRAENSEEKNFHYQKLLLSQKYNLLKPVKESKYSFYSAWYHPIVRELVIAKDFDGTSAWIAKRIKPNISVADVENSLHILERLGFIAKIGKNKWKQTFPLTTTGSDVQSLLIHEYHRNLLLITREVMSKIDLEKRDISTLVLGIQKSEVSKLKEKIREFRKEILKLVANEAPTEEVYLMNIQLLPVT